MRAIEVSDVVRSGDAMVITSLTGWKNSTAAFLALREAGVESRLGFADTASRFSVVLLSRRTWERYLDFLEAQGSFAWAEAA